jgi:hypothetical protein
LPLEGGRTVPLYLISFDKRGLCQSPLTLAYLLTQVDTGIYTDVHVFSHGWNNVFKDALSLYRRFFENYFTLREKFGLNNPAKYCPALVGIVWPSTLLVAPWEATPKIAAISPATEDLAAEADRAALEDIAESVSPDHLGRLYEFAERGATLNPAEAKELASILLPIYREAAAQQTTKELASTTPVGAEAVPELTAEQLLAVWQLLSPAHEADEKAGFAPDTAKPPAQPLPASFLGWLDPRQPIRVASVLKMKDRAGTVGFYGLGPLLVQKLLASKKARIHLIGHSYGAKVMLSALCGHPVAARADSLLLLEPAISYLAFGQKIDGRDLNGGYRDALNRVEQPILSTFSAKDGPLTTVFHLAVIRPSDCGEQRIAGMPPNRFAALGGFGPGGLAAGEGRTIDMPAVGVKYPRQEAGIQIYGVDGSHGQINGHGDVATPYTAWAHLNLVSGSELN